MPASKPQFTSHTDLGKKVRAKAKREGITLFALADQIGIEHANLYHVLSGRIPGKHWKPILKRWLKS